MMIAAQDRGVVGAKMTDTVTTESAIPHADKTEITDPVEISDGIFWVGQRAGVLLERNIYLRVFGGGGAQRVSMLIDPGPPSDLEALGDKVGRVIGHLRNVNLVFANHQDPDVTYNAGYLQKLNPNLFVVCSEDTWRLIQFYNLRPENYRAVEKFRGMRTRFPSGQVVSFVPTPFCHFRGAMMLYDLESRVLFTGDLFGGLSYVPDLHADERQWDGIKAFHQIYMPSQDALKLAIQRIRSLDPPPLMIAPQHGAIISGEWIQIYLDRLAELPVGLDLILDSQTKDNYIAAMNELLLELSRKLGAGSVATAVSVFKEDGSFPEILHADASGVRDIRVDLPTALDLFTNTLRRQLPGHDDLIEISVIKVLLGRNIPVPSSLTTGGAASPEFLDAG